MPSIKPIMLIDLLSTFWIIVIALILFVWLPICGIKADNDVIANSSFNENKIYKSWLLGLWIRNILLVTVGVLSLGYFNLINWLTLALLYLTCIAFNYLKSYGWKIDFFSQAIHNNIINLVDFLDRGILLTDVINKIGNNYRKIKQYSSDRLADLVSRRGILFLVLLTAVLGFTLLLRWEYPLAELRFSHPDNYNTLLITRQLLAKNYPSINYFPVIPSFATIISLLGSIEPMQAIRFFIPLLGIVLVISLGFTVRVFTNNAYSALTAMFTLGVYLFTLKISNLNIDWLNKIIESLNSSLVRQWTGNELELGTIFLLLGLGYCFAWDCEASSRHRSLQKTIGFKLNVVCSVILVGICAPPLLIIFAIASIGLIGDKRLTLTAITISWITLAIFAAMSQGKLIWLQSFLLTLPVALSIFAGLLFGFISDLAKTFSPKWGEVFCL